MGDTISAIHLVELAIAITVLEGLAIALFHRMTQKGLAPGDFALNLISGLCLMLALHNALSQSLWIWVALWLLCAGLVHWADIWHRWQAKNSRNPPPP